MMMRDSKGRFSTTREQTKDELKPEPKCIRYYSDKLDKYFENYEDLVNAEKAKEEEQKAIESQRNEKRELGAKVEEAFKNYESAINESNEKTALSLSRTISSCQTRERAAGASAAGALPES